MSYDMIDRFLRNNLDDDDYAEYSLALDQVASPLQRTWVGLTDDERLFLHGHDSELNDLISVIEAKLKAKNDRP